MNPDPARPNDKRPVSMPKTGLNRTTSSVARRSQGDPWLCVPGLLRVCLCRKQIF